MDDRKYYYIRNAKDWQFGEGEASSFASQLSAASSVVLVDAKIVSVKKANLSYGKFDRVYTKSWFPNTELLFSLDGVISQMHDMLVVVSNGLSNASDEEVAEYIVSKLDGIIGAGGAYGDYLSIYDALLGLLGYRYNVPDFGYQVARMKLCAAILQAKTGQKYAVDSKQERYAVSGANTAENAISWGWLAPASKKGWIEGVIDSCVKAFGEYELCPIPWTVYDKVDWSQAIVADYPYDAGVPLEKWAAQKLGCGVTSIRYVARQ